MKDQIRREGLITSLVIEAVGTVIFLAAFLSPKWVYIGEPDQTFGIWLTCSMAEGERNCSRFQHSPELKDVWYGEKQDLAFVKTVQVFSVIALFLLVASFVFCCLCFFMYNAGLIATACGFQFFAGMMLLTACLEWGRDYKRAGDSLLWGYHLAVVSGCILAVNGLLYALLVCLGIGMVKHHFKHGILFRGEAEKAIKMELEARKSIFAPV